MTGGFDSRPYRLPWPPQTLLFDISPPVPNNEWLEGLKGTIAGYRNPGPVIVTEVGHAAAAVVDVALRLHCRRTMALTRSLVLKRK